jgi:aromatic ring-opening dioxygenase LigB subunit
MPNIVFAAISPHPPLILPKVGSKEDRNQVKKTIESLEFLGKKFSVAKPDSVIISSPHEDWGFNVPLHFLAPDFKGKIETYLTGLEAPAFYFGEGKKAYETKIKNSKLKFALIASGDLSHVLKEDGAYGFDPQGPRFDMEFANALKNKNIDKILELDEDFPQAADCGLGSFCFILGILEAARIDWKPEILSYEGPFGVGYLVADFKINEIIP